jgi:putative resolvase
MKLSAYARRVGVNYKTAWRWGRAGKRDAYQAASGTAIVRELAETATPSPANHHVAISARVSAAENRPYLESHAERLIEYCAAKGYQAHQVLKEIGSGVSHPKFLKVLADPTIKGIVVEHKDRATRFGFHSIETLLEYQG